MGDDLIEKVAKRFHEIYFNHFWDGAIREGRVTREYDEEHNSWEDFGESHKEALRATIKELIESGMIEIGG